MNFFKKRPYSVFYEYFKRTAIGPTGDFVEAGVYWTIKPVGCLEVQADKVWYEFKNGALFRTKPEAFTPVTNNELTWLRLSATQLEWFD